MKNIQSTSLVLSEMKSKLHSARERVERDFAEDFLPWGVLTVLFIIVGAITEVALRHSPHLLILCFFYYAVLAALIVLGYIGQNRRLQKDTEVTELTSQISDYEATLQANLEARDKHLSAAETPLDEEADRLLRAATAGDEPTEQLLQACQGEQS